eukprot:GHVP01036652.1.p1 GENE.GHVP01036652.1~~GHVP01036652.1.p1  ORF type:complete len:257 (+),score=35.20 GHVP01036652.1:2-772(+)
MIQRNIFLLYLSRFVGDDKQVEFEYRVFPEGKMEEYQNVIDIEGTCRLLQSSFPAGIYAQPEQCRVNFIRTIERYDNIYGINRRNGEVISLLTSERLENNERRVIIFYNVCVGEEYRGKGHAKRLIRRRMRIEEEDRTLGGRKLIFGLDINKVNKSFVEAWGLYVSLGFIRGIKQCQGVGKANLLEYKTTDMFFKILKDPDEIMKGEKVRTGVVCMFRYGTEVEYGAEDRKEMYQIGKRIADMVDVKNNGPLTSEV